MRTKELWNNGKWVCIGTTKLESTEVDHKVCRGNKSQRLVPRLQRQLPKSCKEKQIYNGASSKRQSQDEVKKRTKEQQTEDYPKSYIKLMVPFIKTSWIILVQRDKQNG